MISVFDTPALSAAASLENVAIFSWKLRDEDLRIYRHAIWSHAIDAGKQSNFISFLL